ncbi:hypothetical protein prwr041_17220 [Prevotella herbatica]|uniref:Major fimbrial subunit protein N-terminal domain-containing protein n=2 Tax=Prevotella herbatica TaxID=2801997 RepID=A0ABN6EKF1_9BACT|nr:hypothetical protein prwr041_17220 [Prevotella herbatica]
MQSCSENDNPEDDKAVVVLTCKSLDSETSTKQDSSVTRAITSTTENQINNVTVFIFDSNGDVIGSGYGAGDITHTGASVTITTRPAVGCTIYVVANVSSGTFKGVYNKTLFDQQYATITAPSYLQDDKTNIDTYPIMFAQEAGVEIKSGTKLEKTIAVARLLSKITFNIKPKKTSASLYPITIDGYQLHHVPLACYYVDTYTSEPNTVSYGDFDPVALTTKTTDGNTLSFTYYVYENLAGKNSASTTWKDRNKINTSGLNVSYLTVDAHTDIWKSRFYIYLGGKILTSTGTSGATYDYSDYNIYRNTNYTVTVNITGSGASEDDVRVDYDANIYFDAPGIKQWTNNSIDVSM